jgi:hypothetical protein
MRTLAAAVVMAACSASGVTRGAGQSPERRGPLAALPSRPGPHVDKPERLGVYVYDPNTNAWADEVLAVPEKLGHNRQAKNGFYDPELNVVFLHSAGDSRDDGTIWVFRYRQ